MELISEYYNEDGDRRAEILIDAVNTKHVRFYRNERMVEERAYPEKALCYVEDAADNWIRGILKI